MSRIAYVNGRYRPHSEAMIHVEDRGFQFSDGVYEVCEVRGGRLVDERRHMARLKRSLDALRIELPMSFPALGIVLRETVRRNRVRDGLVYLQVTRGTARRDHGFPPAGTAPGIVVTVPDNRWARVDIKAVSLLPNILAKQAARERGAREAWFVDAQGFVTEGSSSNAWIVTAGGEVITRPADHSILNGISRAVVLDAVAAQGLTLIERAFTVKEAQAAREAFVTAASQIVEPVVLIDGKPVGGGRPGPVATALRREFHRHAELS
jgi:D-alanine transaminase